MDNQRLFLIDGTAYIYRSFYAIRNLSRKDGFATNAIFGFTKMLKKLLDEQKPSHLAMVFDAKGPTFRHQLDDNYKANRKPMPDALRGQIPIIKAIVSALNIPIFEVSGVEADDVLATLSKQALVEGMPAVIVSGDKDLMQMVRQGIVQYDPSKDIWFDAEGVKDHWGVEPDKIVDLLALTGDSADNIPGVPGIGKKTAAMLLRDFGSLESLLERLDTIKQPKRRQNLLEHAEQIVQSKTLVLVRQDVDVSYDESLCLRREEDLEQLFEIFKEMEFFSLIKSWDGGKTEVVSSVVDDEPEDEKECSYQTIITSQDFEVFMDRLKQESIFSLDTETTSKDPVQAELVGLSFSWKSYEAVYIPVAHVDTPDGQLPFESVLSALKPILEDPNYKKVGQNLKYEYVVFKKYGIQLTGIAEDSMILSHILYGGSRRHNLDVIAELELGRKTISFKEVAGVGKKQLRFDQISLDKAGPYACEDAEVTWQAVEKMAPRINATESFLSLYDTIERPLIDVLGDMELFGVLVDQEVLRSLSLKWADRLAVLEEKIHQLAGETFNINSPKQLGEILFDKMGLKGGKRTKTGFSTNVTVLEKLSEKGHELPARVLDYRSLTKLRSTYSEALLKLLDPSTGRIHTHFNQAATSTGRLSSSDPNLQNIPIRTEEGREIRKAFIAENGYRLLAADYSQIELRLLAHMGKVDVLKDAFLKDQDIHAHTAAELFAVDQHAVTSEQRRMAKTINFGLIYGMSPFGLAKRLDVPLSEARRYMDLYFTRYHGVKEYMEEAKAFARDKGYVETLAGRRCYIPEINSTRKQMREFAERTAINAPLQGSAADVIKRAMIDLHQRLRENHLKSRMLIQVHDELVLEVADEEISVVQDLVRETMEGAYTLSVPLKVDMGLGLNWAEAH
ncbi:DNA polymerase I [Magnetococcales bacterium HHB-1]